VTPALVALVLGTGLLALIPTRRLARTTTDRWVIAAYYVVVWLLLVGAVLAPGLRRLAVPLLLVLAIAPWLSLRGAWDRLVGRRGSRPPPRNVTPPDAGGPWRP
jgi:hypothetical protein